MSKFSRIFPSKARRVCPIDGDACRYPCFKLVHARMDARLSDQDVIEKLGTGRSTCWRYRRGQQRPALAVCGYLASLSGRLPFTGAWSRFSFNVHNGRLFHDTLRDGFLPEDLLSLHWLKQEVTYLRRCIAGERELGSPAEIHVVRPPPPSDVLVARLK